MLKKTVLSGIKPSGIPTLGNYIGAISKWVPLQDQYETCLFSIVDLHALTVAQDPKELTEQTYTLAAFLLAAGIDPKRSILFLQSQVPAHAELGWLMTTQSTLGELLRMTQFKDKAGVTPLLEGPAIEESYELSEANQKTIDHIQGRVNARKDMLLANQEQRIILTSDQLGQMKLEGDQDDQAFLEIRSRFDQIYKLLGPIFAQIENRRSETSTGLLVYPSLMAADILLYQTDVVPVGDDQKQHVELARDLAERFNKRYGKTFIVPTPIIAKEGARIMSLDDPTQKMSKSNDREKSYILITDTPEQIRKKIMSATTDSGSTIVFDAARQGLHNLLTIYKVLSGMTEKQIEKKFAGAGYGTFKADLADLIIQTLSPIQAKMKKLLADRKGLDRILSAGAKRAAKLAAPTLTKSKQRLGLVGE